VDARLLFPAFLVRLRMALIEPSKICITRKTTMNDTNTYQPPQSDVTPPHQNQTIGGWLRFYQVTNYISLILGSLVVVGVCIAALFVDDMFEKQWDLPALILELSPSIIFSFLIIRVLSTPESQVPAQIKKYIGNYVVVSILINIGLRYLFSNDLITDEPTTFIGDLIYYAIWVSYFKRSKRVAQFYGQDETQENTQVTDQPATQGEK